MCLGQTVLTAAVLLAGGSPGEHPVLPNTRVLIHQPAIQGAQGQATDLATIAEEIDRMRTWLGETLSEHSGRTSEQMHEDIDRDKILVATQAKEYGLTGRVFSPRKGSNN